MIPIEISDLHFSYPDGTQALEGINVSIPAGQAVALVGHNGAGKSTLARHLNGLLQPSKGNILVGGWNTRDYPVDELASRVGYAFQNPDDQIFSRTVGEELRFGPTNLGFTPTQIEERVNDALSLLGLIGMQNTNPFDLQWAVRRRVAISAVVAMDTPILVLDEPTGGQDRAGREQLGKLVLALRERGKTVLAITHDLEFAAEFFERILVMKAGKLIGDGESHNILADDQLLISTGLVLPPLFQLGKQLKLPGAACSMDEFFDLYKRKVEK